MAKLNAYFAPLAFGAALTLITPAVALAASIDDLNKLKGAERETALIAGARKEGKVVLYSAMIQNQALRPLQAAFKKKYPFIDAQFQRSNSRELINKTLSELRAKALVVDVVEGGGLSQPLLKAGALSPAILPGTSALPKELYDPKGFWTATRVSYFGIGYNTKAVPPADVPKTYEDLLDPKWQGKLAWAAHTETGGAMMFITFIRTWMGDKKADAYLQKLAKQKVINVSGSPRTLVNRIVAGEYKIGLNIFLHHPIISSLKGAPTSSQPMDPVIGNASVMALVKGSKHPHAALLLMDYLISKEGQTVIRDANYFPADRSIPVKKVVQKIVPGNIGMKLHFLSEETLFKNRSASIALQKKYFGRR